MKAGKLSVTNINKYPKKYCTHCCPILVAKMHGQFGKLAKKMGIAFGNAHRYL
jgi:hypothetical protein